MVTTNNGGKLSEWDIFLASSGAPSPQDRRTKFPRQAGLFCLTVIRAVVPYPRRFEIPIKGYVVESVREAGSSREKLQWLLVESSL